MLTYYKVVQNLAGRFYSAQITGSYQLEYLVGTWIKPTLGRIFLFSTAQAATDFIGGAPGVLETKECHARNIGIAAIVLPDSDVIQASNTNQHRLEIFKDYWKDGYKQGYRYADLSANITVLRPPAGTLIAGSIKLL